MRHEGYGAIGASTGVDALALLEKSTVDVIVTDLIMPGVDGFEILRRLRTDADAPPVILITGGGRAGAVQYGEIAKALGAAATLQKPFSFSALTDTIKAVTRARSPLPKGRG